jgi:hypothetical protein
VTELTGPCRRRRIVAPFLPMNAPRNDWPPPQPPYGYGPPGQPPPAAGPGGPPPPPSFGPPPPGLVIVSVGLFILLAQFVPDIGRWITLLIGFIFLAAFVAKREYGFLVPGCIVSGVGVGVVLAGALDDPWSGAAVLFSIAGGFIAIWVVSVLIRSADKGWPGGDSRDVARALWWPLIPGGILALVGLVVLAEDGIASDVLRWWPVLIIGAGLIILVSALRRRDDGPAR